MTVYVDALEEWGWRLRGRATKSCHMFTDPADLSELHALAAAIGMRREWFQDHRRAPHYDLTSHRRQAALAAGAVAVTRTEAVRIWRERRAKATGWLWRLTATFHAASRAAPAPSNHQAQGSRTPHDDT